MAVKCQSVGVNIKRTSSAGLPGNRAGCGFAQVAEGAEGAEGWHRVLKISSMSKVSDHGRNESVAVSLPSIRWTFRP